MLPDLLQAADLAVLPQTPKWRYMPGADLSTAAVELNELFGWYALWAAGQHARAPRNEVRDWCGQIAGQASNLMHALGLDCGSLPGKRFEDVLLHFAVAWPDPDLTTGGPPRELQARHMLDRLVYRAQPELFEAERDLTSDPAREVAWDCIGTRLAATLRLLQLPAERSQGHYASRVAKGGTRQEARKHLFCNLAGTYERLFGCLPGAPSHAATTAEQAAGERRSTLPKGPALEWHRALLRLIGARAADALPLCAPSGATPDADRTVLLGELVGLAAAAAKGKAADGLAHWIRESSAIVARRPPVVTEVYTPDHPPTPFEDLFG